MSNTRDIEFFLERFWVTNRDSGAPKRPRNALAKLMSSSRDNDYIQPLSESDYKLAIDSLLRLERRNKTWYQAVVKRYIFGVFSVKKASASLGMSESTYKTNFKLGLAFLSALIYSFDKTT